MTLFMLCGAVLLGDLLERERNFRLPIFAFILIWALTLWLPFAWTAARSPISLQLTESDYAEYINSAASGFGLSELIAVLTPRQPAHVIGVLANCVSLRELASFPVECPRVNPNGEDIQTISQLLATSREANTYAVLEALAYAPTSAPGTPIAVIDVRQPHLTIYDLAP